MWRISAVFWGLAVLAKLHYGAASSESFVDLSNKNLSSVPGDLPHRVEHLDLSRNHIGQLRRGDFRETAQLRFLNMSWNNLRTIDPEVFADTPLLQVLELSHNALTNLDDQRYLRHTRNLRTLRLHQNKFINMTLGKEFSLLKNLKTLSLEAEHICKGDFKQISEVKLMSIFLYVGNIFDYEATSLQDVTAQKITISFEKKLLMYDLVSEALSIFEKVELTNLTKGYEQLIEIFKNKKQFRTTSLSLSNFIIGWTDFTNFINATLQTSILHLAHADVALTKLPNDDTPGIETSTVRSFTLKRIEVRSFFFSQKAVYNFFINTPVKKLGLLETGIVHMTCPHSPSPVQHLDFSHCALSDSLFYMVEHDEIIECKNLGGVKTVILVDNNLKDFQTVSRRMQHFVSLKKLDVSLNSLFYDGLEDCLWPQNVSVMNLSFNSLADSVFKCLPKGIQTLDLENNQVSVVPSSAMAFPHLLSLNLNDNRLLDLAVCTGFPLLDTLSLKSNSLTAPSVVKLQTCPMLKTLDISDNPFTCVCSLRKFKIFGVKSETDPTGIKLVDWPMGYLCLYPEELKNTSLQAASIPEIYCNSGLLAATILCPTIFSIIVIVTACQYFDVPWYLGMIWQWTRAKHRTMRQNIPIEELVGVEFHAFVSFSQRNADWVHNSLLPNLSGLRVCHHEKHFLPGRTIVQNIMRSVQKSRRSVFVLSAHFVKSDWCHYELYFATHQRLARGPDSVVLVLLEPLPQYLIPSKYHQLKSMMRRHTYLEWPQEKAKQRLFWANLRAALQSDIPNNAHTTELEE